MRRADPAGWCCSLPLLQILIEILICWSVGRWLSGGVTRVYDRHPTQCSVHYLLRWIPQCLTAKQAAVSVEANMVWPRRSRRTDIASAETIELVLWS